MKALLLGWSAIGRRRVLPALAGAGIREVDVASRSNAARVEWPAGLSGRAYDDYAGALRQSDARLVYVTTVNSLHEELAAAALESGRHVVVDKPATLDLEGALRLARVAGDRGLLVAEATVYPHHPQIEAMRRFFAGADVRPNQVVATFSFPPLPPDNFRHDPDLGGGALFDLGPYAMTPGRLFFEAEPDEVLARSFRRGASRVEDAFSVLATYPEGRSLVGHFGMTTGYVNRLEVLGPDASVAALRAFTTTPDQPAELRTAHRNERRTLSVPAADAYASFLGAALAAIETGSTEGFARTMVEDARSLERLRQACQEIRP